MQDRKFLDYFRQLTEVSGVEDVGYHRILDGRVCPVSKTNTSSLSLEKWKEAHQKTPVLVGETQILQEIVSSQKPVVVNDVKNDPRSASAFFLFGIDSILVIPIVIENCVIGIYCIASIGKLHPFTEKQIEDCVSIIEASKKEIKYVESEG